MHSDNEPMSDSESGSPSPDGHPQQLRKPLAEASLPNEDISHSKPITPADIFDLESPTRISAQPPDLRTDAFESDEGPTSSQLMPPPPRPPPKQQQQSTQPNQSPGQSARELEPPASPPYPEDETINVQDEAYYQEHNFETGMYNIGANDAPEEDPVPGALGELDLPTSQATEPQDLPEDPLEPFDWDELEQQYHAIVVEKEKEFDEIWTEYCQLQDFFSIWTGMIGKRETERTFKRHKTQQFYVRQEEEKLDKLREHYVGVMNAFKSAMALFND
ncbi:hypothetical protein K461DRAFT_290879 [Myriangium duriaei CBS 260.36]|uniref:Uncharacterized protein n=1 Tax=Myriangium duriaei CBS 260.36 TaxID=1168546 RepID=A0A9P4JA30_9PEZI|nr:hypothetical protein K461DRAFT_290879 [Myriangium duriaei CBS 260.36]